MATKTHFLLVNTLRRQGVVDPTTLPTTHHHHHHDSLGGDVLGKFGEHVVQIDVGILVIRDANVVVGYVDSTVVIKQRSKPCIHACFNACILQ